MGFCGTCTNILFVFFNVLIFLIGAALLGLGIWSYVHAESFYDIEASKDIEEVLKYYGDLGEHIGIVLIVLGSVCILISILACVASGMRSRCLLAVYLSILFAVFACSLAFAIYVLIKWKDHNGTDLQDAKERAKITWGVLFGFSGVMLITFILGACFCSCVERGRDAVI